VLNLYQMFGTDFHLDCERLRAEGAHGVFSDAAARPKKGVSKPAPQSPPSRPAQSYEENHLSIEVPPVVDSGRKSSEERKELLARTISGQIANGSRVESQSDFQAVVVKGKPVNHVLHLILTLVTFLLWSPVWIAMAIFGGEKRAMVTVDEYGNAAVQKV
jgi:hypothetical protein